MVKLKESSREPIRSDRYYIWTWRPDTTNKYITEKKLYRKHLTGIPYFTRYQIKRLLLTCMELMFFNIFISYQVGNSLGWV